MTNNINTLLNSLSNLGEIRKADKNIGEYSSESDFTMAVSKPIKYKYFPTSKQELQEIIAEKILDEGYECDLNDICIKGVGDDLSDLFNLFSFDDFWKKYFINNNKINIGKFNGHIEDWDVSNVSNMSDMLCGCSNFDQDLSRWDVSNVEDMYGMFRGCSHFNQVLSEWDVSNVEDMDWMFYDCSTFNQNLSNWDVSNVEDWVNVFKNCPIKEEYKPLKFRNL